MDKTHKENVYKSCLDLFCVGELNVFHSYLFHHVLTAAANLGYLFYGWVMIQYYVSHSTTQIVSVWATESSSSWPQYLFGVFLILWFFFRSYSLSNSTRIWGVQVWLDLETRWYNQSSLSSEFQLHFSLYAGSFVDSACVGKTVAFLWWQVVVIITQAKIKAGRAAHGSTVL